MSDMWDEIRAAGRRPMPEHEVPEDERMSAAEFRVATEWLGLRQRDVAAILEVNERTVRSWLSGRDLVPDGVRIRMEEIREYTDSVVGEVAAAVGDARDPVLVVYRTDDDLWAERPEFAPYPAGWWRMVVARAVDGFDGVPIVYAEDVEA